MKSISPLRYPGGKNWLFFKPNICLPLALAKSSKLLIEPFAGSGKMALTLLHYGLIQQAVLVELDPQIAAFWKKALSTDEIIEKLEAFDTSDEDAIHSVLENPDRDTAWWTFVKSRVAVNGNLTGGNMRDLDCRFGKKGLLKQLRIVRQLSPRIEFIEGDGIEVLNRYRDNAEVGAFLDPPYVEAGQGLYFKGASPHERLFSVLSGWRGRWVMTYDERPEITGAIPEFVPPGGCWFGARMKTGQHENKHELVFVSKNLAGLHDIVRWYAQDYFAPGQTGIRRIPPCPEAIPRL
jgi:DNA adenine methylase